jgi:hypothetical protein
MSISVAASSRVFGGDVDCTTGVGDMTFEVPCEGEGVLVAEPVEDPKYLEMNDCCCGCGNCESGLDTPLTLISVEDLRPVRPLAPCEFPTACL